MEDWGWSKAVSTRVLNTIGLNGSVILVESAEAFKQSAFSPRNSLVLFQPASFTSKVAVYFPESETVVGQAQVAECTAEC
jgi:hypothetical protein